MRAILNDKELIGVDINSETLLALAQECLAHYADLEKGYAFGVMLEYLYDLREPWDAMFGSFFSDIVNLANDWPTLECFEHMTELPDSLMNRFIVVADCLLPCLITLEQTSND